LSYEASLTAYSYSRAKDMIGAPKINGSRDLTTFLSGIICHPWMGIFNIEDAYQITSLYVHALRRYERRYKV